MEVERRTYDADIQEFERHQGNEDGFDDFLMKYAYDNDELSNARTIFYERELKILKNLFQKIILSTKNRERHAMDYIEIMNLLKDGVIDVSDACFIQVDALELISQTKHHWTYSAMIDFLAECHLKHNLKNFDDQEYDDDVDGGIGAVDDVESEAELALKVIDQYNKHKGAKLKLVRMIKVNFLFGYFFHFYITFSAVDEDTGRIGTYQAALAERRSVCIIGLFRDVDADKTLSILSIKGAEKEVNNKLIQEASFLAKHLVKGGSVSSDDVDAGAEEEINYNLIDGAASLDNTCLVKDESRSCNNVSSDSASEMSWVAIEPRDCKLKLE